MINEVLYSHNIYEWQTPKELYDGLNLEFCFALDACTTKDNPLHTPFIYTKEDDALSKPWMSTTYCNPPYGRDVGKWIKKALEESWKGNTIVMLLPARTDTKWFHEYIYNRPNVMIRFIKGRLKFRGANNSAPFPSMIVIFYNNI